MIMSASISRYQQLPIPPDQPPKQALDNPHSFDALLSLHDKTSMAPHQTQQLQQLGASLIRERDDRVGLDRLNRERGRGGRAEMRRRVGAPGGGGAGWVRLGRGTGGGGGRVGEGEEPERVFGG